MDGNNWRPAAQTQASAAAPAQAQAQAQAEPPTSMDAGDWRTQLQPDSRQRIVNKIMDTLKRHLPFSGQDGLHEVRKIAVRFEEKIYSAAIDQSDYLRKISLKMLMMESKSQNAIPTNALASHGMQPQVHTQGELLPIPGMKFYEEDPCLHDLVSYAIANNFH
ncbi:mediator of RNA polymerase II transcription subunit 15a-like isoform X2 [Malania oleifera]|uniref:mediator of RNA polymerase II transcription subunit 15a-like isoform X2 n=1 Tax=Malania oleifera TaxID=397392 RepID=UPI0025ADD6C1|nr:mediator of RNA polymerase II transcription subunit 15a-like isoform X2 [Malania oleifera]